MHCIFLYTLQTKHMPCPTAVTQLVESTGRHSCSEFFFLHLIQDIMDVTTISNKTFEEAILIIHSLIDQMIDKRMFISSGVGVSVHLRWDGTHVYNLFKDMIFLKTCARYG